MPRRNSIKLVCGCIGVMVLVCLAVDLGRIYLVRLRVRSAVDVAVLGASIELPLESAAHERALTILQEYQYNWEAPYWMEELLPADVVRWLSQLLDIKLPAILSDVEWREVRVVINPGDPMGSAFGPPESDAVLAIWIDTAFSRDASAAEPIDTANAIRVTARERVPTVFLWLVGIGQVPVEHSAEAETWVNEMVVVVSDISGDVGFSALCSGCWTSGCAYDDCWTRCSVENAPTVCAGRSTAVLASLASAEAGDLTGIVDGMKRGIAAFDSAGDRYGQSRALRLITVITDTVPDTMPQDESPGQECWRGESLAAGLSEGDGARLVEEQAAACALYYAREAAASGIVVCTVSVGVDADRYLMQEIAQSSWGIHVWTETPDELDLALYELFYAGRGPRLAD